MSPEKEQPREASIGKWVAGLASAVIGGVLIWWLTSAGGPLDPKDPNVLVTALSTYPTAQVGATPSGAASVENSGDGTAESCRVLWSQFTGNPHDSPYPASTDFSLGPGEERDVTLATRSTYSSAGTFEMAVQLVCEDDESQVVTKTVSVR